MTLVFFLVKGPLLGRGHQRGLADDFGLFTILGRIVRRNAQIVPALLLFLLNRFGIDRILRVKNQFRFLRLGRSVRCRSRRNAVFVHIKVGPVLAGRRVHLQFRFRHFVGVIKRTRHKLNVRMHLSALEKVPGHCRSLDPVSLIVRTFQQGFETRGGRHFLSFKIVISLGSTDPNPKRFLLSFFWRAEITHEKPRG